MRETRCHKCERPTPANELAAYGRRCESCYVGLTPGTTGATWVGRGTGGCGGGRRVARKGTTPSDMVCAGKD